MLNLIPPEIKEDQHAASKVYSFVSLYIIITTILILSAVGLSTLNFVKSAQNASIQGDIDNYVAQQKKQGDVSSKAAFISDRLKIASQYKETVAWDQVLQKIADNTPTGVQLSSIKIAPDATKALTVSLGGTSSDRRTPILFNDRLSKVTQFLSPTLQSIGDGGTDGKTFTFSIAFILQNGSFKLGDNK